MKIIFSIAIFAAVIATVVAFHQRTLRPATQIIAGIDASLSVDRDCAGLAKETERLLSSEGIAEGSMLTLLATGITRVNAEPRRLFDQGVPIASDGPFGRDDEGFARKREDLIAAMRNACETAPPSKDSPVVALVRRGIEHLRSRGCAPGAMCLAVFLSDLEDDTDSSLAGVIRKAVRQPGIGLPGELAGSIDNAGIHVQFCGTSEIQPRRHGRHAAPDVLARLWSALFTHPDLVSFQPYCGR